MTTSIPVERDDHGAPPTAADSTNRERSSSRREAILLVALLGLAVAVVLVGLAFPELLAPAAAVAVLVAIVALDCVLPSGELRPPHRGRSSRGRDAAASPFGGQ
jgi:uncharacterized membrane protein